MSPKSTIRFAAGISLLLLITATGLSQDTKYANYAEALRAGGDLYNSQKYSESRGPLEAAAKLAESDREKCTVHDLLIVANAKCGDYERMYESAEFVVEHAPFPSMAAISCFTFLGHVEIQKQREAARKRYEERLAKDANDRVSLYILARLHKELTRDYPKQVEYLSRLRALDEEAGEEFDVALASDLASAFGRSRKYVESAELFEKIAAMDKAEEASHYKEAAGSWVHAKQPRKAIAAARKADALGPGKRAKRSLDRWHAELGEVFLATNQRALAVKHYEQAVEKARTDSYKKRYAEQLEKAKKL